MSNQFDDIVTHLQEAIDAKDRNKANRAIQDIIRSFQSSPEMLKPATAENILAGLNKHRWFELTCNLGQLPAIRNVSRPARRFLAQALIEIGKLDAAKRELERQDATTDLTPSERSEVVGLLGRIRKQIFIDDRRAWGAADPSLVEQAIKPYLKEYQMDPSNHSWHGINVVALIKRAEQERIKLSVPINPGNLANEILYNLQVKKNGPGWDAWDPGIAAEAQLALGNLTEAAKLLQDYAWNAQISAFNLGSTLRQFEEIWDLGQADEKSRSLLHLLRSRLLEVEGGQVLLSGDEVRNTLQKSADRVQFEKVFGTDHFTTYERYKTGLERCRYVVRIGRESSKGDGTGFLMRGGDLFAELGDQPVLLTNAHVLNIDTTIGLHPQEVNVYFHAMENVLPDEPFAIKSILWISSKTDCDCTIAILDRYPTTKCKYPVAPVMPIKPSNTSKSRVLIIGYPEGGTLSFSLNDNELLDYDNRLMHYRAPTEGGSSGSPVFNQEWKLIGLHHGGGDALMKLNSQTGTYQANEGIRIDAIRDKFRAEYKLGQSMWKLD